jgi:protein phosphatase
MKPSDVAAVLGTLSRKPLDDEVDVYGLTHPGLVRQTNQDHFLIGSLRKLMEVHYTSLPDVEQLPLAGERLAYLAMVADGVGSGEKGGEASRLTVEVASQYAAYGMSCYYTADSRDEKSFFDALQEAAMQCHSTVLDRAEGDPSRRGMATTLTLWIGVWPWSYLLQVGDSRCYVFHGGQLTQISRDQTMAQALVDQGVVERSEIMNSRWANVLSSAIGGHEAAPVVTRIRQSWKSVGLLCSDGLTKHVSDEQIAERLGTMTSAKQVCEALLQDALDDGGTDNITIIVGRAVHNDEA